MQPGINTGVVQTLERISPHASLGLCQRIMTPLKKEGKIALPRQLHLSHWGINCCAETVSESLLFWFALLVVH